MHSFMNAKAMAKLLRQALGERHIDITHSDSLELVSRQFGFANWNMLSARIDRAIAGSGPLPDGWFKAGKSPQLYDTRIDQENGATALIASRPDLLDEVRGDDFCTIMQSVDAEAFRHRRMRLAGELRTEDVGTGATVWFRIDGAGGTLLFDNLELQRPDGPLVGTQDWAERSVVFDVPDTALSLHYGFFLKGTGRCWARRFSLVEVDASVPTNSRKGPVLPRPTNLDFGRPAAH
ncbi:glyoxalase superfamily protein [Devosia beringensis]|uniref:glyoxalase superfamily protein n=1 Tax=Devosia beringensis TaxID=2657486 RepID=UPI00186B976C|nr:glyoxalase superfamily protein [Devosia beringensis]